MRKIILIYILLCGCISCKSQEFNVHQMVTFDEKVFENWKVDKKDFAFPQPDKYLKKGNKRIHIQYNRDFISVIASDIITPYEYISAYDLHTKQQVAKGQLFYYSEFGIWEYQDQNGKIVNQINYDTLCKFSIEDVVQKIKKEYNVNLLDKTNLATLQRANNKDGQYYMEMSPERKKTYKEHFYYIVIFNSKEDRTKRDNFIILDGDMGSILYDFKRDGVLKDSNKGWNPLDNLLEQIDKEK